MRRLLLDDTIHFLTVVTVSRLPVFRNEAACQILKQQTDQVLSQYSAKAEAFAICYDHYHLAFRLGNGELRGTIIKLINGRSSFFINKALGRAGKLWGNKWLRFIGSEKAYWRVVGYIIGNPLKHGIVQNFNQLIEYKFSTFRDIVQIQGRSFAENIVREAIDLNI